MGIGQKAMLFSYKALAQAGYDLIKDAEALEKVREEFRNKNTKAYASRMDRDYMGF